MQWAQRQKGFTIVELLIVVVVIAILAAITIVSYNGITQKAKLSSIASALNAYEKAIKLHIVDKGALPETSGCLGRSEDYPNADGFPAGACVMSGTTVTDSYSAAVNNDLLSFLSTQPSVTVPPATIDYGGGSIYHYRGVWFHTYGDGSLTYELQYILTGKQDCPRGDASYQASSNATRCVLEVDG